MDHRLLTDYFSPERSKIALWIIFTLILSPFIIISFSVALNIPVEKIIPDIFDNQTPFYFLRFVIYLWFLAAVYLLLPLDFLTNKFYPSAAVSPPETNAYFNLIVFLTIPVYTYLLACAFNGFASAIIKIIRNRHKITKKQLIPAIFSIVVIFLISLPILKNIYRPGPVFFKLDEENSRYTIVKDNSADGSPPNYFVVYNSSTNKDRGNIQILVGKSQVDLDEYVGKNLKIIGSYSGRVDDVQCIKDKCHKIAKSLVVDIKNVNIVEK